MFINFCEKILDSMNTSSEYISNDYLQDFLFKKESEIKKTVDRYVYLYNLWAWGSPSETFDTNWEKKSANFWSLFLPPVRRNLSNVHHTRDIYLYNKKVFLKKSHYSSSGHVMFKNFIFQTNVAESETNEVRESSWTFTQAKYPST